MDSSKFKQPAGHENPDSLPFREQTWAASPITVGGFALSKGLMARINQFEPLPVKEPAKAMPNIAKPIQAWDGLYYLGKDPQQPTVGDLKVTFEQVAPGPVSIVARQVGKTFEPFPVEGYGKIELLQAGQQSAERMFQIEAYQNVMLTWILRGVGFVLMFIGLLFAGRPAVAVADFVPFLGTLLQTGIAFFAFALAAILSLVTISVAWLAYRPLIGGSLLVAAIALAVFTLREKGRGAARN